MLSVIVRKMPAVPKVAHVLVGMTTRELSVTRRFSDAKVGRGTDMSRIMGKPTFWFPTRSNTNRAVQLQKMARD